MRSRNIKPGFFQNEVLPELSAHTRLLFIGLWCLCDWEGRMELRPKRILMSIFPYEQHLDINQMLLELHNTGFITIYGDGKYLQVNNFSKHQSPVKKEREKPSEIPSQNQLDIRTIPARSQNDPGMIPVALIPDILKPDVLIPETVKIEPVGSDEEAVKEKKKQTNPNVDIIITCFNETGKLLGWTPFKPTARSTRINTVIANRANDPEFMANLPKYAKMIQSQKWTEGWGIETFLRPGNMKKCLDGFWDKNKQETTQEDIDMSKPWNNPDYVPEQPMRVSQ